MLKPGGGGILSLPVRSISEFAVNSNFRRRISPRWSFSPFGSDRVRTYMVWEGAERQLNYSGPRVHVGRTISVKLYTIHMRLSGALLHPYQVHIGVKWPPSIYYFLQIDNRRKIYLLSACLSFNFIAFTPFYELW